MAVHENNSAAYDLSLFEERQEQVQERQLRVIRNQSRPVASRMFGQTPIVLVFVSAIVVSVLALFIYNNVILSEISAEYSAASSHLKDLQNESVLLQNSLESKMSAKNIEDSAVNQLGMAKLERNQIRYIYLESEDMIQVAPDAVRQESWLDKIISKIKAYWK